ncbi:MAG: universal stress protein, partial [Tagaea sp.]|nr:universal stress protein [Tagaea sp.]
MTPSHNPAAAGFRDLVVYADENARARLAFAARLARHQGAHLVALHALTEPNLPPSVRAFAGTSLMESLRDQVRETAAAVRKIVAETGNAEGIDIEYREAWGIPGDVALVHARHADAMVVPQPDRRASGDAAMLAETLVMEAGRPVLIVPNAGTYPGRTDRVVCAWNGTRESARAVADALPLLRRAEKVSILSVDPEGAERRVPGA